MATGFFILLPLGSLTARYLRAYLPFQKWLGPHAAIQLIALPIICTGFGVGVHVAKYNGQWKVPHTKIGLTLFLMYWIQLVLGICTASTPSVALGSAKPDPTAAPDTRHPLKARPCEPPTPSPPEPTPSPKLSSQIPAHDPLVPPKSLLKAPLHPRTHNHPVALLHLRSYYHPNLDTFIHLAYHAAYALGIPLSHPTPLPTQRSLFTVPKSPFIFKKAQENFEKRTHKRAVKVWDAEDEVVNIWLRYLEEHMVPGVGMRVVRWERCAVGVGEARWKEVGERVVGVGEQVRQIGERIVREEADAARKAVEVKAE
ncbi:unnamed protein product [Rhizoctonia solani]|uniref:Small ribosomal subunit protein uS10m n=1 Tax=Rhizoctonia solani TaxID=456999 RepID=A0A8H3E0A7_9AGAM|nr:unnamed protein product [Rhizoctonia solani]